MFLSTSTLLAQPQSTSPYSRFGFGDLEFGSSAALWSQSGAFTAVFDTNVVNPGNPASYAFLAKHRPILDVGVSAKFNQFETSGDVDYGRTSGLRNIMMGIPISKRLGGSFGLMPYSSQGYTIKEDYILDDDTPLSYLYTGDGGINRLYGGLALKVVDKLVNDSIKVKTTRTIPVDKRTSFVDSIEVITVKRPVTYRHQLSFGGNASFLFGTLSKSRRVEYDNITYLNTLVNSSVRVADVMFNFGLSYIGDVSPNTRISFGSTYSLGNDMKSTRDFFSASYIVDGFGLDVMRDTIEMTSDISGSIRLPKTFSYGLGIETLTGKMNSSDLSYGRLRISLQGSQTQWSDYREIFEGDTINDNLNNSATYGLGLEFQPQVNRIGDKTGYLSLVSYRLGFTTTQSFLSLNDTRIDNYGMRFGLGLPLLNTASTSSLNIGFELGKRGTIDNNLIKESYFGLFIGISLSPSNYNLWFRKRKYD